MRACIQKWGNSLALRIPKSAAAETGLREGSAVELSLAAGSLIVRPVAREPLSLAELLSQVTDENLPGEWPTGPAVGREAW